METFKYKSFIAERDGKVIKIYTNWVLVDILVFAEESEAIEQIETYIKTADYLSKEANQDV